MKTQRIANPSWRLDPRTARGLQFTAEQSLRCPRTLSSATFSSGSNGARRWKEPVRDAALVISLVTIVISIIVGEVIS